MVETSEWDDVFAMRRNFTLELLRFGAFSVATEAAECKGRDISPCQLLLWL